MVELLAVLLTFLLVTSVVSLAYGIARLWAAIRGEPWLR